MAEGASRHWLSAQREGRSLADDHDGVVGDGQSDGQAVTDEDDAARLATRLADFAWAGLRQVHRI
jgi:hypothetical protein